MDSTQIKLASAKIAQGNKVAFFLPAQPSLDEYCAANAMASTLRLAGKEVSVYCASSITAPGFFPEGITIKDSLSSGEELVIKVSSKESQPSEIRYEKKDGELYIHLKAGATALSPKQVSASSPAADVPLAVVIGAPELESLGSLFEQWPEVFFNSHIITLSNKQSHSYFGAINFVNPNIATVSELVMDFMTQSGIAFSQKDIVTLLFAGMAAGTDNFKSPRTTPALLAKASDLMNAGADHSSVIRTLYKTKPLPVVQLWGRALARVEELFDGRILFSHLIPSDFQKTNSGLTELKHAMKDMAEMGTRYDAVVVYAQLPDSSMLHIVGKPHFNAQKLLGMFGVNNAPVEQITQDRIHSWSAVGSTGPDEVKAKTSLAINQ